MTADGAGREFDGRIPYEAFGNLQGGLDRISESASQLTQRATLEPDSIASEDPRLQDLTKSTSSSEAP